MAPFFLGGIYPMDPIIIDALIAGAIELLFVPIIVFVLKRTLGKRLDKFDEKRDQARMELAEAERVARDQRDAERGIVLSIARTMLLDNYEKCIEKGYYSVEEREVYHKLYTSYRSDNGNGIIEELAPRIRALPIEPPNHGDLRRD